MSEIWVDKCRMAYGHLLTLRCTCHIAYCGTYGFIRSAGLFKKSVCGQAMSEIWVDKRRMAHGQLLTP